MRNIVKKEEKINEMFKLVNSLHIFFMVGTEKIDQIDQMIKFSS